MLLKIKDPSTLAKSIDLISELVTEVRIKLSDYGLSITSMDPANVAMVHFKIPKSAFSEFQAGEETLGVNLDNLRKVLRRAGSKSTLIMEKNTESEALNITIHDRVKRSFSLSLIDVESEEKEVPNLEFSAKIELPSGDLNDAIEDSAVVADACSFEVSEEKFIIQAEGMNSSKVEFSSDEATIEAEDCKSRYSLEYLQKFMKAGKITDKVELRFANEHPLKMDFNTEHLSLTFILAPRMENEE